MQTPWSSVAFARRLHGVIEDVTASSTRRQRSANAVKARRMRCERRGRAESTVRAQRISTMNTVGTQKNAMRASWQRLGHCKDAVTDNFFMKNIMIFLRSHGALEN